MYNNSVLAGATMQTEGKLLAACITELVSIQEANVGIPEIPLSRKEVIQTAEMIKS